MPTLKDFMQIFDDVEFIVECSTGGRVCGSRNAMEYILGDSVQFKIMSADIRGSFIHVFLDDAGLVDRKYNEKIENIFDVYNQ